MHRDGGQARTGAQRGFSGESRGTGHADATADHEHVPMAALVRRTCASWQRGWQDRLVEQVREPVAADVRSG